MSVWHGSLRKRKRTGGRKRANRVKRNYEKGGFPAETVLGETRRRNTRARRRNTRGRGGKIKTRVLSDKHASVTDPKNGTTEKAEILRVVKNNANVDYNRRGVITKGAEIETSLGLARVTSRPGGDGVINAVLISSKEEKR